MKPAEVELKIHWVEQFLCCHPHEISAEHCPTCYHVDLLKLLLGMTFMAIICCADTFSCNIMYLNQ